MGGYRPVLGAPSPGATKGSCSAPPTIITVVVSETCRTRTSRSQGRARRRTAAPREPHQEVSLWDQTQSVKGVGRCPVSSRTCSSGARQTRSPGPRLSCLARRAPVVPWQDPALASEPGSWGLGLLATEDGGPRVVLLSTGVSSRLEETFPMPERGTATLLVRAETCSEGREGVASAECSKLGSAPGPRTWLPLGVSVVQSWELLLTRRRGHFRFSPSSETFRTWQHVGLAALVPTGGNLSRTFSWSIKVVCRCGVVLRHTCAVQRLQHRR